MPVIDDRIKELLAAYKDLSIIDNGDEECFKITGKIHVFRSLKQYTLNKIYDIALYVPHDIKFLPYVFETGDAIDEDYPHRYDNGRLCLATDIDMAEAFERDLSLVAWMRDFVEPYFVSYEYYKRYGEFPMGDREHGEEGILSSYAENFSVDDRAALLMVCYIAKDSYRGHSPCPCGSGEKLRKCHGEIILRYINSPRLLEQTQRDYRIILKRLRHEFARQYNDSKISK